MDEKIPEPLSRPVDPTKPGANVPSASAAPSATESSTPMGMPAANVGKAGKGKKVLVAFLVLVLMASTAAFGYLWWQARSAQAELSQAKSDKVAAEKKLAEAEAKMDTDKEKKDADANDVRRKDDLSAISSGLEQYYNDNQSYPATLAELIDGKYLKAIPTDSTTKGDYSYVPAGANTNKTYKTFRLQATLENDTDKDVKSGTVGIYEIVNKQ